MMFSMAVADCASSSRRNLSELKPCSLPSSAHGLPHLLGRDTTTVLGGSLQPFLRDSWILIGPAFWTKPLVTLEVPEQFADAELVVAQVAFFDGSITFK